MTINAYPLTWPPAFPRTQTREKGQFKTSLAGALKNVDDSLRRFASDSVKAIDSIVMSSNLTLGIQRPEDPGVAVWFTWDGLGICIAVDRYLAVEANLQAIHHIIEARRVELRHGTLALVRATFTGFLALPSPAGSDWWDVLDVPRGSSETVIKNAYMRLRSQHHPDKGGDAAMFDQVEQAYRKATA